MREPSRIFIFIGEDSLGDVAAETGREADQPFRVLRQEIEIDARLVIEPVKVGGGDELDEIAVALLRLAQQHQVVVAILIGARLVPLLRDVHLAADHGMHARGFAGVVELHGPEKVAVIGHGHGGHFLLGDDLHQLGDGAGAIKQ